MSNLFDVANKNVRGGGEKTKRGVWVIAKTREGYRINQGVDKSGIFCLAVATRFAAAAAVRRKKSVFM